MITLSSNTKGLTLLHQVVEYIWESLNNCFFIRDGSLLGTKLYKHDRRHWGGLTTKLSVGVSDKVIFKLACSATETSWNCETSLVEYLDIILFVTRTTKALIRLCVSAGWSAPVLFANTRFEAQCSLSRMS